VTGITAYLLNGGSLETAQAIANHDRRARRNSTIGRATRLRSITIWDKRELITEPSIISAGDRLRLALFAIITQKAMHEVVVLNP
jgi:hypothetical protein